MTGERTGPLTWAQQEWFADLGAQEDDASLAAANAAAHLEGHRLPVATVMTALDDVVARQEGLRTLIDRSADGRRVQITCNDGRLHDAIAVAAAGPDADAAFAEAASTVFQLHKQWPVRFVLATDGDAVTGIAAILDHVTADAWAFKVLTGDVEAALRARSAGRAADGPRVEQPLDTAEWESGPAGARQAERAVRFWRRQLAALRDGLGGWTPAAGPAPAAPMLRQHRLVSGAVAAAAETVHAATGTRPSTLYLSAFAAAVAEAESSGVAGVHALTTNRLTPAVEASVRKAVMPTLVVVPAGDFVERLAATSAQQLEGARFANVPPGAVAEAEEEILGDRRRSGAAAARFNFIDNSVVPAHLNTASLDATKLRFVDPRTQGRVTADPPRPGGSRYILSVQHHPRGALLTLACHEDTAWHPVAADMLWHIEDLIVWAATGHTGPAPRFGRRR